MLSHGKGNRNFASKIGSKDKTNGRDPALAGALRCGLLPGLHYCAKHIRRRREIPQPGRALRHQGVAGAVPRRNTIESRNDRVKSSRHQGHGDPTMRIMRAWAAQAISAVMSAVAANIGLLSAESRWRFPKKPTPPTTPPGGRNLSGRDETGTDAFPNAPLLAA